MALAKVDIFRSFIESFCFEIKKNIYKLLFQNLWHFDAKCDFFPCSAPIMAKGSHFEQFRRKSMRWNR
jgi:hypothetical protein